MPIRKPHVAGAFYPANASELRQFCEAQLRSEEPVVAARAVILPHAGYVYSGKTACEAVKRISVPGKILLMGPNHSGLGAPFSIMKDGAWETPLGTSKVDEALACALLDASDSLTDDSAGHLFEHALEVELPFFQYKNPYAAIVPLTVSTSSIKQARAVAEEIGACLAHIQAPLLIAVSTDMSHYESDEATRRKDRYALDAIENLDADALAKAVREYRITMCGFVPVYMLLVMAGILKFRKARLVDYRTSADVTGDTERVVGYAGFIVE